MATSFGVTATAAGAASNEGLVVPEHVANSASLKIQASACASKCARASGWRLSVCGWNARLRFAQAGVGRLPAIKLIADGLMGALDVSAARVRTVDWL